MGINIIELFLINTWVGVPKPSEKSIEDTLFNSQLLCTKEYGFDVKAPTGHKSITLPDNSD